MFFKNYLHVHPFFLSVVLLYITSCLFSCLFFFDENLTMDKHVSNICKSSFYHLWNIAAIRGALTKPSVLSFPSFHHDCISAIVCYLDFHNTPYTSYNQCRMLLLAWLLEPRNMITSYQYFITGSPYISEFGSKSSFSRLRLFINSPLFTSGTCYIFVMSGLVYGHRLSHSTYPYPASLAMETEHSPALHLIFGTHCHLTQNNRSIFKRQLKTHLFKQIP